MFLSMRGIDFLRVQGGGTSRTPDPLDPNVLFSGGYEDGQGLFYQVAVDALGIANSKSYTINFGRVFSRPPMVFGILRLTQPCTQSGKVWFNSGEYLAPCAYRRNIYGVGVQTDWFFNWLTYTDRIVTNIGGFTGTASFLALEIE